MDFYEFKTFIKLLKITIEYQMMFIKLDFNNNNYLSFDEFQKAIPLLESWGINIFDPVES